MKYKIEIPDLTKIVDNSDTFYYTNILNYYPKRCQSFLKTKKNIRCNNQTNCIFKTFCGKHKESMNNDQVFIYLLKFPNEIISKIIFHIDDPIDKIRLSTTCKKLNLIYNETPLYYKINSKMKNINDKINTFISIKHKYHCYFNKMQILYINNMFIININNGLINEIQLIKCNNKLEYKYY